MLWSAGFFPLDFFSETHAWASEASEDFLAIVKAHHDVMVYDY